MCGVNSYCENTDNNGEIYMRANSYCDNNREAYVQC